MAGGRSTASRPFTPGCAEGFSLIELLVALVVTVTLVGAALTVALSSREGYAADQDRTRINQNLRGALDLVGVEVRQAGERLPADFPAAEIVDGADGGPDTLIMRRNLLDEVLPLCGRLEAGTVDAELQVADSGGSPAQGCSPLADANSDGWPDNIGVWREHRDAHGGQVRAYVFNPVEQRGEWFLFDGDGSGPDFLGKGNIDPWQHTYEVTQQCRVYLLEEREYTLQDGLLRFRLNADGGDGVNVSAGMTEFQVRAVLTDGTMLDALDASTAWNGLLAIEVRLASEAEIRERTLTRTVSSRFFPRNVLSN